MFKFSKKDDSKYQSTINLIYDRNINTLRSKVKILIVGDEEFVLINILKERKYDIYWKKDITYAVEAEPFDIVVIDIIGIAKSLGSGMGGFAIAKEIDGYISKDTDLDKWAEKFAELFAS